LTDYFTRAAESYERWALPQRESARRLVAFVRPYGLTLDLGCGTGFVSEAAVNALPVGLDRSEGMLRVYRRRFPLAVRGELEALPFKEKSFEFVLSNFSLHWGNWERGLKEALRVARRAVGVALPVEGSRTFSSFPFPKAEEVLRRFPGEHFLLELPIPFEGLELVRFFHYTGTSVYEGKKTPSVSELKRRLPTFKDAFFKVLYLKIEL